MKPVQTVPLFLQNRFMGTISAAAGGRETLGCSGKRQWKQKLWVEFPGKACGDQEGLVRTDPWEKVRSGEASQGYRSRGESIHLMPGWRDGSVGDTQIPKVTLG